MIEFTIPVRTVSETNVRDGHWIVRYRRRKRIRAASMVSTHLALLEQRVSHVAPPITIALTRIGPQQLDGDNLQGALKPVRDGIAKALRFDDGDERVRWPYNQERGQHSVRVRIEELT